MRKNPVLADLDTEIPDSYANLFQCPGNGDWTNMTCSSRGDAETACGVDAVGSWTWVAGGNVTTAQNGQSTCNATDVMNLKNSNSSSSTQATCPACTAAATQSSHHSTVAIGAGLGVGLGIPLLLSTALFIFCARSRRRLTSSQQETNTVQGTAGRSTHPLELNGGGDAAELDSKMRSELRG
ncbi:uncharacterized protein N7498_008825 [Penicillium cinerascens]|uniref:Uncharacterized protein n=1 Tax=Penicillium cinerascens TaxID=70096 RepID=A0A9W9JG75_9EURO|nr:uncharacterized protein N7498_008825 [Penicillium cinerascens]KAJ5195387.1 hypothetical protein N7498_008825 [Penicillium cinerascens]